MNDEWIGLLIFFSILFFLKAVVSLKQKEWKFDYWFISFAESQPLEQGY